MSNIVPSQAQNTGFCWTAVSVLSLATCVTACTSLGIGQSNQQKSQQDSHHNSQLNSSMDKQTLTIQRPLDQALGPNQASYLVEKEASNQQGLPARAMIPLRERGLRPMAKPFSVTGEVVDTWCYASQVMGSGRGEAHKPCALACAHGGVTMGIVDDEGTLYIAAKSKAFNGCKELLIPFMARRVKVSGWLATKGGSNIMKIQKVELAK